MDSQVTQLAVDTNYLARVDGHAGYRIASVLAPPAYLLMVLTRYGRHSLSINNALRATWVSGIGGFGVGAGTSYARTQFASPEATQKRKQSVEYDIDRIKAEDYSIVGSVIGAMIVPAIFWNRGRAVHMILGGAGLGSSAGFITHCYRKFFKA